jgi:hypothetical protein
MGGASGWSAAGKTLGLALDLEAGALLVSVDGAEWAPAPFSHPCKPGADAGAGLFPALSGFLGARVRCNWGVDARRPMRHAPPPGGYRAVGLLPHRDEVDSPPPSPARCGKALRARGEEGGSRLEGGS